MTDETLLSLFQSHRPASPKVFIETPAGRTLTYGAFDALSARVANALRAHGVQPGDRVAAQVDKSPEALAVYVACLRSGAVYLPLNTAYTLAEVEYFIGDAEPRLIVCRPELEGGIAGIAAGGAAAVATLDDQGDGTLMQAAARQPDRFDDVPTTGDDLAAILYTSGTTGRSKGAMLTHGNLASNAATLKDYWRFADDDVLLHALPIYHVHGLFVAVNVVLLAGASMLFLPKFDVDEVVRLLPKATAMMGVPTFYTRLLEHPGFTRDITRHMRLFVAGSAPLLAATHEAFEARTGHKIVERYGMTETNMNASNPYDGRRVPGSVGLPLPGVEIRIADPETGRPLPHGEVGMIEVKGPNVFKGYWRMPEKTATEFRPDGFFITGDLGQFGDDGYLRIVGRGKDLDHLGRIQHLSEGDRGRHRRHRRRPRVRRLRRAAPGFRRRRGGAHRNGTGRRTHRARRSPHPVRQARQVQAAEARVFRTRAAAQYDGQDPEKSLARAVRDDLRDHTGAVIGRSPSPAPRRQRFPFRPPDGARTFIW